MEDFFAVDDSVTLIFEESPVVFELSSTELVAVATRAEEGALWLDPMVQRLSHTSSLLMRFVRLVMSVVRRVRLTSYQERYHNNDISLHLLKTRGTFILDQRGLNLSLPGSSLAQKISCHHI